MSLCWSPLSREPLHCDTSMLKSWHCISLEKLNNLHVFPVWMTLMGPPLRPTTPLLVCPALCHAQTTDWVCNWSHLFFFTLTTSREQTSITRWANVISIQQLYHLQQPQWCLWEEHVLGLSLRNTQPELASHQSVRGEQCIMGYDAISEDLTSLYDLKYSCDTLSEISLALHPT